MRNMHVLSKALINLALCCLCHPLFASSAESEEIGANLPNRGQNRGQVGTPAKQERPLDRNRRDERGTYYRDGRYYRNPAYGVYYEGGPALYYGDGDPGYTTNYYYTQPDQYGVYYAPQPNYSQPYAQQPYYYTPQPNAPQTYSQQPNYSQQYIPQTNYPQQPNAPQQYSQPTNYPQTQY